MVDYYIAITIFGVCMVGAAGTAFYLGRQEGIEGTVQFLIDKGVLEVEVRFIRFRQTSLRYSKDIHIHYCNIHNREIYILFSLL